MFHQWRSFGAQVQGVMVEGDPRVPHTQKWNLWWLVWFGWKTVAVFEVQPIPPGGYRVGFRNIWGETRVLNHPLTNRFFGVRVGHENCTFFAVSTQSSQEIPIRFVVRTTKDHPADMWEVRLI